MTSTTIDARGRHDAARSQAPSGPAEDGELTHRQISTILIGLMLGMFLASLDQTIVSTAIRTISDDLDGLSAQAWVTTAYLITSTISTPLYGKLSDIYGRKPFFIAAISIFIVGSILCTFSTSMYMLAAFRAIQGLGAGGLMSLALAIIGDIVPPRERAKYQGYFLAVFGTSSVLGPVIGGFFAGTESILGVTGWRWVFLVNVPIGILALVVVSATLHLNTVRKDHRIDWLGAVTIVIGLVPLLTVLEQGREWGWSSGKSLTGFAISAVGIVAFIFAEARAKEEALIPLRIFRDRTITLTIIGSLIIGAGMFGGMMVLPLYLQIVQGATPTSSGFMMIPMVAGIMVSSIVSGQVISRTGRIRIFPIIGSLLIIGGYLLLGTIGADTDLWVVMIYMFVFGLGLGSCMQPLTLIIQNAVAPTEIGMATASATFFRQMGSTIGVAAFLSVLFNNLPGKLTDSITSAMSDSSFRSVLGDASVRSNPANADVLAFFTGKNRDFAANLSNDTAVLQNIDSRLAHPFQVGFSDAMSQIFFIGAAVTAVALLVLAFIPKVTLRTASASSLARQGANGAGANGAGAPTGATAVGGSSEGAVAGVGDERADVAGTDGAGHELALSDAQAYQARQAHGASAGHRLAALDLLTDSGQDGEYPDYADFTGDGATRGRHAVLGHVTGTAGRPVERATVTLTDMQGRQVDTATADSRGRYLMRADASGSHLLIVSSPRFAPFARIVHTAERPTRCDITLAGRSSLSGRLIRPDNGLDDQLNGGARNSAAQVRLTLVDGSGAVIASQSPQDDRYHFDGLEGGHYVLTALTANRRPDAIRVDIAEGTSVVADLRLSGGGHVAGRIVAGAQQQPVAGAYVSLIDGDGQLVASARTGADGAYWFEGVDSGDYTLTAAGFAPVAQHVRAVEGEVTSRVVTLGDDSPAALESGSDEAGAAAVTRGAEARLLD